MLAVALVAACGSAPPSSTPAGPSVGPSLSAAPASVPRTSAAPRIAVDQRLLDLLPDAVDGVPLQFSADASAQVATDPGLAASLQSVAYALAVDPADDQLLVAAVSRLRAAVFGDGFFRTWRAGYDREVCAQAGGVRDGSAEAEIGGRNVFIGSCVNGGNTYHVWLDGRRSIVSAVSFGDRRFGERLMETLEE